MLEPFVDADVIIGDSPLVTPFCGADALVPDIISPDNIIKITDVLKINA